MIDIIVPANRELHLRTLREMFRLRYRLAMEKGRLLDCVEPGIDRDAFDTPLTAYLIRSLPDGTVTAGCRFNPTTQPHMLSTLYADCCDKAMPPAGENIYEFSRLIFNELDLDERALTAARHEFMYGIVEFCMRVGIQQISWRARLASYERFFHLWPSHPLGALREERDGLYGAALSQMDKVALNNVAACGEIPQPVLRCVEAVPIVPPLLIGLQDQVLSRGSVEAQGADRIH